MNVENALEMVQAELSRAMKKFPTWPTDPLHALVVYHEEKGELDKAVLQLVYEPEKSSYKHVLEEAVRRAAMAVRFLVGLQMYEFKPGHQHWQIGDAEPKEGPRG